jgi:hypothetical protein
MKGNLLAIYKVLDYLLTKAVLTGKLQNTKIRIPYSELAESVGQQSNKNAILVVELKFKWDAT